MRIKRALIRRTRKRKLFKLARGFTGRRKNALRTTIEAVHHALAYSYQHRRRKKRDFRRLWITRLNAAVRAHGMSYSRFIHGLAQSDIALNRKILSNMAIDDPAGFGKLVDIVKAHVAGAQA